MAASTPTPSTRRDAGRDGGAKSPRPTVVNVMTAKYAALPKVIPSHHDVTTVTKRIYPAFQINAWMNMCQFVVSLPILSHRTLRSIHASEILEHLNVLS